MNTFLISDLHLGHNNMYKYKNRDGSLVRPWATNANEGDQIMLDNWNRVVNPKDRVYILGDLAIPRKAIKKIEAFNGRKVLIKGNHDIFKLKDYLPYFDDIRGLHKLDKYILSHVPLHSDSIARWTKGNIHGHIHANRVMKKTWYGRQIPDERYINVCVEMINATPISFDEIRKIHAD